MSTLVQHRRGPIDRALVSLGALVVFYGSDWLVLPPWQRWIDPWRMQLRPGPRLLMGHLVTHSLPLAILSGVAVVD